MFKTWLKSFGFVLLVMISLLLLYTAYDKQTKTLQFEKVITVLSFSDTKLSLNELNKITALGAIGIIAIVFMLGPLSKFFPKIFAHYLIYRKPVGLIGFAFALIHSVYSAYVFYSFNLDKIISGGRIIPFTAGLLSLFIFFLMAVTSTESAVKKLGYKNWKVLQTFGYIGLLFAVVHFFVIETKPVIGFDVRPYGVAFFVIAVVALLLRLFLVFVQVKERKAYHEHFGQKK
ncbi:MAG: ferric reductase-like transmembrane domain-containing protein [Candidatus Micrarchaeota archaeon]